MHDEAQPVTRCTDVGVCRIKRWYLLHVFTCYEKLKALHHIRGNYSHYREYLLPCRLAQNLHKTPKRNTNQNYMCILTLNFWMSIPARFPSASPFESMLSLALSELAAAAASVHSDAPEHTRRLNVS